MNTSWSLNVAARTILLSGRRSCIWSTGNVRLADFQPWAGGRGELAVSHPYGKSLPWSYIGDAGDTLAVVRPPDYRESPTNGKQRAE
jgi:hypothetical protein